MREDLDEFSKEQLIDYIEDLSKNWLAIDGTWFQAVEKEFGLEKAIELDIIQWDRFTVIEANRIMKRFNIRENGGIPALIEALNEYDARIQEESRKTIIYLSEPIHMM